ncbi:hypothetical protein [Parasphingorhabdus sp.]|uniref:hypothetical protein n=1 Tax=Parasphingorhabdus sp. TaxID=2709688 RepID=UPI003A8DC59F
MHKLEKRLRKIEAWTTVDVPHAVQWTAGETFEDALARSYRPHNATSRRLIHLQVVEGGHGSPVVPVPMSADQKAEYAKAQSWAAGAD